MSTKADEVSNFLIFQITFYIINDKKNIMLFVQQNNYRICDYREIQFRYSKILERAIRMYVCMYGCTSKLQ